MELFLRKVFCKGLEGAEGVHQIAVRGILYDFIQPIAALELDSKTLDCVHSPERSDQRNAEDSHGAAGGNEGTHQFFIGSRSGENPDTLFTMFFRQMLANKEKLLVYIEKWFSAGDTYSVRFGIKMLMEHFLGEDFSLEYPKAVAKIKSEEYYIRMMQAWYFATALAKQYEAVLPFIENRALKKWTHNKAIQKAIESYRITDGRKEYLKTLKI